MSRATSELINKVNSIREILKNRATNDGPYDDAEYQSLRRELLATPHIRNKLPSFVRSCRNLDDFWSFIKPEFAHYQERRDYLREQFDPLLTQLEDMAVQVPVDDPVVQALTVVTSDHVHDAWQKALDRRSNDPEGAITSARTLLETVCKYILDESGVPYDNKDDLPKLYRLVAEKLNLAPSQHEQQVFQHEQQVFKQILGGCQAVVEGLGSLRNRLGDAHGKGILQAKPSPRHAQLAVNLAGAMATFLVETWETRQK